MESLNRYPYQTSGFNPSQNIPIVDNIPPSSGISLCNQVSGLFNSIINFIAVKQKKEDSSFNISEVSHDLAMLITSDLSVRDLFVFRLASKSCLQITQVALTHRINSGVITSCDLRMMTLKHMINFFGKSCAEIFKLDLREFYNVQNADIKKIAESFTGIKELSLKSPDLTDDSAPHFIKMTTLKSLDISSCKKIENLEFVQHCTNLTSLGLSKCDQIKDLNFLPGEIVSLDLKFLDEIKDSNFLKQLSSLTNLNLGAWLQLQNLNLLQDAKELTTLFLGGCKKIKDFSSLQYLSKLTSLNLEYCDQVKDIEFLKVCTSLTSLDLSKASSISNFSILKLLSELTTLNLAGSKISDITFLHNYKGLKSLNLEGCREIKDFSPLHHCTGLMSLNLHGCSPIMDFSFLELFHELTSLNLGKCPTLKDISFLRSLTKLKSLNLEGCIEINDFSFIELLLELENLNLEWCTQINNISSFSNLKGFLNFDNSTKVSDFSFLQHCKKLKNLNLRGCQINDIRFLKLLPHLLSIDLGHCALISNVELKALDKRGIKIFL